MKNKVYAIDYAISIIDDSFDTIIEVIVSNEEEKLLWRYVATDDKQVKILSNELRVYFSELKKAFPKAPIVLVKRLLDSFSHKKNLDPARIEVVWE